ncbi:MAG: hydrogenase maturation protease [Terriglobales bacterium]
MTKDSTQSPAQTTPQHRVVVLGMGNLIRSDDGVGIHAIQRLLADPRIPAGVEVMDGGTLGLQLLPAIEDATHILVLDAVNTGAAPGATVRYAMTELEPLPGSPSVHQIGFADMLEGLRWMNSFSNKTIVLLGVQPEQTGWGESLSPTVEAALPALIQATLEELQKWRATIETPASALHSRYSAPFAG